MHGYRPARPNIALLSVIALLFAVGLVLLIHSLKDTEGVWSGGFSPRDRGEVPVPRP